MKNTASFTALAALCLTAASASAQQFAITWHSTASGGNTHPSAGGSYGLAGTIGQHEAGPPLSSPTYGVTGGFNVQTGPAAPPPCYANCDASTNIPILNVNDFICFNNLFAAQNPAANCDQSTNPPVLNVNDYLCFINRYATGCP